MTDETASRVQATREIRLRRTAQRRGLRLVKSRRRDPKALDFGRWWVLSDGAVVFGGKWGADLDEIETYLNGETR